MHIYGACGGPSHLWLDPPNTSERPELFISLVPRDGPKEGLLEPHSCRSSPANFILLLTLGHSLGLTGRSQQMLVEERVQTHPADTTDRQVVNCLSLWIHKEQLPDQGVPCWVKGWSLFSPPLARRLESEPQV